MHSTAGTKPYVVDASHSSVEFVVRHMVFSKVRGQFRVVSGTADIAGNGIPARISAEIEAASVDTREEQRDNHLRSADFLHVEEHSKLTFASSEVLPGDDTHFTIVGDLTIRGTTNRVELAGTIDGRGKDPWGNDRIAYTAKTTIDRRAFGLVWTAALETGGLLVGDEVEIELSVQVVPAPATA
jgi:polyisoprenoid-binding protein YceI